jgi:hypothetical protein
VALPEQVRKQSEAVQQLYLELNQETPEETQAASSEEATPEADSVTETAKQPVQNEQTRAGTQQGESFEQKYRTLQGMYNAEVPRLHAQNKELQAKISNLEQLMASFSTQQPAPESPSKLITDKDIEEYGESIDVMRRVSREEAAAAQARIAELEKLIRQMQTSVVPRVEQIAANHAQSREQQFWTELTSYAPQWATINESPDFREWLLEVDPLTGLTRQVYLEDAQRNLDARRVANFFNSWSGTSESSVAQPNRKVQASQLEKQVAPGRGKTAAPVNTNSATYSTEDIRRFFNDVKSGKYRGKEQERDRIERDIFAAQREGRIVAA